MRPFHPRMPRILFGLLALSLLVVPAWQDAASHAQQVVVTLEQPTLHPSLGPCDETYWYPFENDRGYTATLTLNVYDAMDSTNWAEWLPVLPEAGYYRVEAYIAAHDPITWCSESAPEIADDTADARYVIQHAFGATTVSRNQSPLANEWLDLGEYYFHAGASEGVRLTDLNGEAEFTTTVSFSAMRFTWVGPPPKTSSLPVVPRNVPSELPAPWVDVLAAPGFDLCYLGANSLPTMQVWWEESPYRLVGFYLGGISYSSGCSTFTPDWVAQVRAMGWSFIPIWVGPQAPCPVDKFGHPMDTDPAVTYLQGRHEADLASAAARDFGLTNYLLGGTIIYYDLEAYGPADDACKAAVSAFLNGWTERMHELNNISGIYGGACSSYATSWTTLPNPPDDVWLAYWTGTEYDPTETVLVERCFPDDLYTHRRMQQYTGDHNETWGGMTLDIDCDIADGEVAVPEIGLAGQAAEPSSALQQAGWLSALRGWLVSEGGLYETADGGATWQRQATGLVERARLLPSGQGWAAGGGVLYTRSDWEAGWETISLPPDVRGWRAVQVGMDTAGAGWVVWKQPSSSIFSLGRLLRTADAGQTWQSFALPIAEPLSWVDEQNAWLSGGVSGGDLYRTSDGGKSWQAAALPPELAQAAARVMLSAPQVQADGSLVLTAALAQVKTPQLKTYTSRDGGQTWQPGAQGELHGGAPSQPLPHSASGLSADGQRVISADGRSLVTLDAPLVQLESAAGGLVWAVTRQGTCTGEKGTPGFACRSSDSLWLSLDGGYTWRQVR